MSVTGTPALRTVKIHGGRYELQNQAGEAVVQAVRHYKIDGAGFSGWIVSSTTDRYAYSDPIPNIAEMLAALPAYI